MYRKDFVSVINDLPNRYPIGSNVILDSENNSVTVDGIEKAVDVVQGSNFEYTPETVSLRSIVQTGSRPNPLSK